VAAEVPDSGDEGSVIDLQELRGARWFAGKHRSVVGVRRAGAFASGALTLADVAYADGPPERYLLLAPQLRWGPLLAALRAGPLAGEAGRIELRESPALDALLGTDARTSAERVPSTDQSNTLVTLGDRLLIKAYRKLEAGVHPEVELGAALTGTDAPVPAHAGSLHHVAPDGTDTAIALLQELVVGATSGWEEPIEAIAAHLRAGTGTGPEATAPYAAAGAAAGALHAALIERLGSEPDPSAPARWRAEAERTLADAATLDPTAAAAAPEIARRLAALDRTEAPPLSRIHGDLHFAQFLRTPDRTLVVDLEGDPTAPLADRRRPDTPLRDLAALLRSIDHLATAATRRLPEGVCAPTSARRCWQADPVVAAATAAALAAYEHATGARVDAPLLAALELASECRELVYAHRTLPEWVYAPQAGLRRLLDRPTPS
jgi:maltokinase